MTLSAHAEGKGTNSSLEEKHTTHRKTKSSMKGRRPTECDEEDEEFVRDLQSMAVLF